LATLAPVADHDISSVETLTVEAEAMPEDKFNR
jgi:hypothetical protein